MAQITLKFEIKKLDGFSEEAFIATIRESLIEVGVTKIQYGINENFCTFKIEYNSIQPFGYRPILGCFSTIGQDYPFIEILSTEIKE